MNKESNYYEKLLSVNRLRKSTVTRAAEIDQYYSDRSRILYSSSFRRLQQKAQVFSLEPNSSVRTRLTHSLEVSDIGRTLANRIAYRLCNGKKISRGKIPCIVAVVENACLLHDIGNPPFGHFGEAAIRDWANSNLKKICPVKLSNNGEVLRNRLLKDFAEFDGNPQGFRIITKLHTEHDEFSLNLTYATLLCALKYSRSSDEKSGKGILKKAGYFQTEKSLVEKIYKDVNLELHRRSPYTYIMEAADDIAYCMSDISDGIEKHILTELDFFDMFKEQWHECYSNDEMPVKLLSKAEAKGFNQDISIPWSKMAMDLAVDVFFGREKDMFVGTAKSLIDEKNPMGKVLDTIKKVSKKYLYTSYEAENIELTGYAVITGILKRYECLLKLDYVVFQQLLDFADIKESAVDVERRMLNRIGDRYKKAYKFALNDYRNAMKNEDESFYIHEWWLRIHLILDHVSGMTDEFALETYQMLEGINLMRV